MAEGRIKVSAAPIAASSTVRAQREEQMALASSSSAGCRRRAWRLRVGRVVHRRGWHGRDAAHQFLERLVVPQRLAKRAGHALRGFGGKRAFPALLERDGIGAALSRSRGQAPARPSRRRDRRGSTQAGRPATGLELRTGAAHKAGIGCAWGSLLGVRRSVKRFRSPPCLRGGLFRSCADWSRISSTALAFPLGTCPRASS